MQHRYSNGRIHVFRHLNPDRCLLYASNILYIDVHIHYLSHCCSVSVLVLCSGGVWREAREAVLYLIKSNIWMKALRWHKSDKPHVNEIILIRVKNPCMTHELTFLCYEAEDNKQAKSAILFITIHCSLVFFTRPDLFLIKHREASERQCYSESYFTASGS